MDIQPSNQNATARKAVVLAVLFSFFVGGISGGVAGYAAAVFSQSSALNFFALRLAHTAEKPDS